MSTGDTPRVREVSPSDAWKMLSDDDGAVLIDVRSAPEWGFVGGPDLSGLDRGVVRVEWKVWPGMVPNPAFVGAVLEEVSDLPSALLFICRSGVRSMQAARAVSEHLSAKGTPVECINVAEGFEGDLDELHHRGGLNGWKARGLAWRQS
ncbi:rhodanese-like domain-containing protein [Jannaschia sp. Os4]|uniref:rhodanese-like domain-containing protein n=1 Tax=Jannaschia sp. Os4 TaxID=2807617 RepID=UPI001939DE97|nr:rhodanese-like domain-containing protein [Jannaschia sp. Os4]MBM2575859.1 rhodanese-like domain-containing protein [Jannaschia sp. Os4]